MARLIATARPPENMQARRQVAARLLGSVEFLDDAEATLPCPAANLHSKQDDRPARLYLRGAPSLFCFHDSCRVELERLNDQLRREIGKAERGGAGFSSSKGFQGKLLVYKNYHPRPTEAQLRRQRWERQGPEVLKQALALYPMEPADLWERSPYHLEPDPAGNFTLFMRTLWLPHEIVWVGANEDSGQPRHRENFKPASTWAELGQPVGPQTSAFSFKPGSCSRKKEFIEARRHLVLESDTLTHGQAASVFWWVKERLQLPLRAVVDSGKKSLHAWFAVPDAERLEEMQGVLPHAGMDGKVLKNPGQPVRVPGWMRDTGRLQGLLYLDPAACNL